MCFIKKKTSVLTKTLLEERFGLNVKSCKFFLLVGSISRWCAFNFCSSMGLHDLTLQHHLWFMVTLPDWQEELEAERRRVKEVPPPAASNEALMWVMSMAENPSL